LSSITILVLIPKLYPCIFYECPLCPPVCRAPWEKYIQIITIQFTILAIHLILSYLVSCMIIWIYDKTKK
jgi:hypothetical protein